MNNNTSVNSINLTNNNITGVVFELICPPIIYSIISIIGILFNTSICYITIKYRKYYDTFKSNTAILLSINSFFEILHQTGNFYHLIIALSGINYIQFGNAILFQSHTLIGYYCALFTFNSLSIDRIYSILNQQKYICGHLITIFILICFLIYIIIKTTINNSFKIVNGSIASISSVINQEFFLTYSQFMTLIGIGSYAIVGMVIIVRRVGLH
ncbi:G_PROTEIN_RECEP_F1_2 domain-containing protein [Meloidogyne graminicola]|uniref:G_PROTEIN_RECEP_F1_2 domain-containing protein n=1 Tax=Meloidogyne graminicola TaxID=189291 RepID=A0A8S9ZIK3_9BILA|nr:G_PROTEIN_RECEP_F1_2 domain-containing protein [Meloidogyne graminicola]